MTRVTWLTVCAGAWLVVGASGCSSRPPLDRDGAAGMGSEGGAGGATGGATGTAGGIGGGAAGTGGGSAGTGGGAGRGGTGGGAGGTGGVCTPSVTCTPAGGRYCNTIGNGCPGGRLECGACSASEICAGGVCVGGASCMPLTCNGTVRYCGRIGDGCGRELLCSPCPGGQNCQSGFCFLPACSPVTCNIASGGGGRYCGRIGDGCGGAVDCGACSGGQICGGSFPGVCGTPPSLDPITPPPLPPPLPPPPPPPLAD
jgi:hypothetical protein